MSILLLKKNMKLDLTSRLVNNKSILPQKKNILDTGDRSTYQGVRIVAPKPKGTPFGFGGSNIVCHNL